MTSPSELFLLCLRDPRLGALALSERPAWLWTPEGTRLLWTNAAGAAAWGSATVSALLERGVNPGHRSVREVARLLAALPLSGGARLSRLRGVSPRLSGALLCSCERLRLRDGPAAVLIAASEATGPTLPFGERVRRLFSGAAEVAVFSREGALIYASPRAAAQIAGVTPSHAGAAGPGGRLQLEGIGDCDGAALFATIERFEGEPADAKGLPDGKLEEPGTIRVREHGRGDEALERAGAPPLAPGASPADGHDPEPDVRSPPTGADEAPAPAERSAVVGFVPEAQPSEPEAQAHGAPAPSAPQTPWAEEVSGANAAPSAPARAPAEARGAAPPRERRHPLRFVWQMDAAGRFTIQSEEFLDLVGRPTSDLMGRPWEEIAASLDFDPQGRVAQAVASRDTWSGITVEWPAESFAGGLPVSLSGLPLLERERAFCGYRGFGVCRAVDRIAEAMLARRTARGSGAAPPGPTTPDPPRDAVPAPRSLDPPPEPRLPVEGEPPVPRLHDEVAVLHTAANVLPFRNGPTGERRVGLTPVEHTAFQEIARALGARFEADAQRGETARRDENRSAAVAPAPPEIRAAPDTGPIAPAAPPVAAAPLAQLDPGSSEASRALIAKPDLSEPAIRAEEAVAADDSVHVPPAPSPANPLPETASEAASAGELSVRELHSILDTATDGVLVLDAGGQVLSANRSAEALFGYEAAEVAGRSFTELFAPESQRSARDYLDGLTESGVLSILNDGREVIGRVRQGGLIPLFMTMGRIDETPPKFCAVFRDVTQWKRAEEELTNAKREAEKASVAKSEFLAKVGHEIRTPLNSIIGFSEVMRDGHFGPLGNERYRQYAEEIHRAGEHMISLLNDLLDLSKIEAGKLDLSFGKVVLNDIMQQCVATMQPQANRERIIIRTSLSPSLPPVVADARSIRQIVLNLLSNSIKFTGAGGQVIVSTALSDGGEAVLRVRDTGIGMSEGDIEAALEPFRQIARAGRMPEGTGLGLPLTKALAEANRASFTIKSNVDAGTLVEIVFPPTRVLAE